MNKRDFGEGKQNLLMRKLRRENARILHKNGRQKRHGGRKLCKMG